MMMIKKRVYIRNSILFIIAKAVSVIFALYLLHTNASTDILWWIFLINIAELMILLGSAGEYLLLSCVAISMIEPTNYTLHVLALAPAYMFSQFFKERLATLAMLFIPLLLYKYGWRTQYKLRGWLILTVGGYLSLRDFLLK
jgi:hypothetical protein